MKIFIHLYTNNRIYLHKGYKKKEELSEIVISRFLQKNKFFKFFRPMVYINWKKDTYLNIINLKGELQKWKKTK